MFPNEWISIKLIDKNVLCTTKFATIIYDLLIFNERGLHKTSS